MRAVGLTGLGAVAAVALMVACLWGWQHAAELSGETSRPYVAKWAVRSGAIALAAVAQVLLLTLVIGRFYARQLVDDVLKLLAGLVFAVSLVTAVALGMAAR